MTNVAQLFALVAGVVYLLLGLVGFASTGLEVNAYDSIVANGSDKLAGLELNAFHNVVHIAIGVGFMIASRLDATLTQGIVIGGGLVYLLAALLGFLNELQILSIDSALGGVNFLHLVSGSAAVLAGVVGARQTDELFTRRSARA